MRTLPGILLIIFYSVGLVGLLSPYKELFQDLTPYHLMLSAGLLAWSHPDFNRRFGLFAIVTTVAGFCVELAGVRTGFPFGDYTYGPTLGFKLFSIPVVIGINWLVLIYSMGIILDKMKAGIWVKSFLGAMGLVMLDLLMEPVAIHYDFWTWATSEVPLSNYIGWFSVSLLLLLFFNISRFRKENPLAALMIVSQFLFFGSLNLFIQ